MTKRCERWSADDVAAVLIVIWSVRADAGEIEEAPNFGVGIVRLSGRLNWSPRKRSSQYTLVRSSSIIFVSSDPLGPCCAVVLCLPKSVKDTPNFKMFVKVRDQREGYSVIHCDLK